MVKIQGHRGCRGVYPENTIEGFLEALRIGVDVLEMDVVVSKDHQVVLSHEPFFNHEITTLPNGSTIDETEEKHYNLYDLNYDQIKLYDVGLKPHPRFPQQKKIAAYKPLLYEMFTTIESALVDMGKEITYNIEIKRKKKHDGTYHPPMEQFVELVGNVIEESGCSRRVSVQCFDHEGLAYFHKQFPTIDTVLLVEDYQSSQIHIDKLGFVPTIYSPNYALVDDHLISFCRQYGMQIIPWTVNDIQEGKRLMELGVDAIISDYPQLLIDLRNQY